MGMTRSGAVSVTEREMDQQTMTHTYQCYQCLEFILYLLQKAVFFCGLYAVVPLF